MRTVFIQTNAKQMLGAHLAQYAIGRTLKVPGSVAVRIMNVDELSVFRSISGKQYLREGKSVTYDPKDLQSFTLSRFMPPELMGYEDLAVVIDPDIFALTDINELFDMDMGGNAILACRKKSAWDTSVMLMDCARLRHWKISDLLGQLERKERPYEIIMSLALEQSVGELSRSWNDLDHLVPETKMLHTTNRLTHPWKTGLKIDFTRRFQANRYFGVIPKRWVKRILGRWPTRYQPHPDKNIEQFFFRLLNDALHEGAVTAEQVRAEIDAGNVRPDLLKVAALV